MNVIVTFPMVQAQVVAEVPQGTLAGPVSGNATPFPIYVTAPIRLKIGDELLIDSRDGTLYTISRGSIAIWRNAWVN